MLTVMAVGGGALTGPVAVNAAGPPGSAAPDRAGLPVTGEVTLITGDVVSLGG